MAFIYFTRELIIEAVASSFWFSASGLSPAPFVGHIQTLQWWCQGLIFVAPRRWTGWNAKTVSSLGGERLFGSHEIFNCVYWIFWFIFVKPRESEFIMHAEQLYVQYGSLHSLIFCSDCQALNISSNSQFLWLNSSVVHISFTKCRVCLGFPWIYAHWFSFWSSISHISVHEMFAFLHSWGGEVHRQKVCILWKCEMNLCEKLVSNITAVPTSV